MSNEVLPVGQEVVTVEFPSTREGIGRVRTGLPYKGKPITFDPSIWDLFPQRSDAEYQAFYLSCLEAIREPIWLADFETHWVVADGQDRLRAALDAMDSNPPVQLGVTFRELALKTTDLAHRIAEVREFHFRVNSTDRQHFDLKNKAEAIMNLLTFDAEQGIHRSNKWLAALIECDDSHVSKIRKGMIERGTITPGLKILTREIGKDGRYKAIDNPDHSDNREVKSVAVAIKPRKIEFKKIEDRPEDRPEVEEQDEDVADEEVEAGSTEKVEIEDDGEEVETEDDGEEIETEEPDSFFRPAVAELLQNAGLIEPTAEPSDETVMTVLSRATAKYSPIELREALTPLAKLLEPAEQATGEPQTLEDATKAFQATPAYKAANEALVEPAYPGRKSRKPKQAENTPA